MRYNAVPALDQAYRLIAALYEVEDQPEHAMTIADALVAVGESRSWASVWWAYGAIHFDLSDEAYARALELLAKVDRPSEARAAALMLRAEIESTRAIEANRSPDERRQLELLSEALAHAPGWPNLRVRLARASLAMGDHAAARRHAEIAVERLDQADSPGDPFDSALSGIALDRGYVAQELGLLGLMKT